MKYFLIFILSTLFSVAQHPAQWMSGEFGIGFRINADDKNLVSSYEVNTLVDDVASVPGVKYVIFNLSDAAHGDAYLAPHSILTNLTPTATPNDDRDLFLELATAFQAKGIKVIAYMATQGPAMLKHGAAAAFDKELDANGNYFSQAMQNWEDYVREQYGKVTTAIYKRAYVEVIVKEYAERYKDVIDGWWFDHSGFANIPLLHDTLEAIDPTDVMTFNVGQKIPLINNSPGYEDYTFGHPTPVKQKPTSDVANLPMLTSIEDTPDGFFEAQGSYSLGHMFITPSEVWNAGALVWEKDQAEEWQNRCLAAGGAWTWNLDLDDDNYTLRSDLSSFIKSFNPMTPYLEWLSGHGETGFSTSEDVDKDGLPNILEYALGTSPVDTSDARGIQNHSINETFHFITLVRDPESLVDTSHFLEYSTDLSEWTTVDISNDDAAYVLFKPKASGMEEVTVKLRIDNTSDQELFWRFKADLE